MTTTEAPKTYSFKKILLILWIIVTVAFIVIGGDGSGGGFIYVVYGMTAFPTSMGFMGLAEPFAQNCNLWCQIVIVFFAGIVQWVLIVGSLLDWIVPKLSSIDNTRTPK
jgi:hypothetical protein